MTLSQAQVPDLYNGENINIHLLDQLASVTALRLEQMDGSSSIDQAQPALLEVWRRGGVGGVVRLDWGVLRFPPRPAG